MKLPESFPNNISSSIKALQPCMLPTLLEDRGYPMYIGSTDPLELARQELRAVRTLIAIGRVAVTNGGMATKAKPL